MTAGRRAAGRRASATTPGYSTATRRGRGARGPAARAGPSVPPPPPRAPEPVAVLDLETLERVRELGTSAGFVEKLIGVFIADNSTLLGRIEQALAARNCHELRSLLHAMKGSSASMGTDRLTQLCASLGRLSDAELRQQAPALLRTLSEELAAAHTQLEGYVAH